MHVCVSPCVHVRMVCIHTRLGGTARGDGAAVGTGDDFEGAADGNTERRRDAAAAAAAAVGDDIALGCCRARGLRAVLNCC